MRHVRISSQSWISTLSPAGRSTSQEKVPPVIDENSPPSAICCRYVDVSLCAGGASESVQSGGCKRVGLGARRLTCNVDAALFFSRERDEERSAFRGPPVDLGRPQTEASYRLGYCRSCEAGAVARGLVQLRTLTASCPGQKSTMADTHANSTRSHTTSPPLGGHSRTLCSVVLVVLAVGAAGAIVELVSVEVALPDAEEADMTVRVKVVVAEREVVRAVSVEEANGAVVCAETDDSAPRKSNEGSASSMMSGHGGAVRSQSLQLSET